MPDPQPLRITVILRRRTVRIDYRVTPDIRLEWRFAEPAREGPPDDAEEGVIVTACWNSWIARGRR